MRRMEAARRGISMLLAVLTVAFMLPLQAMAANPEGGDGAVVSAQHDISGLTLDEWRSTVTAQVTGQQGDILMVGFYAEGEQVAIGRFLGAAQSVLAQDVDNGTISVPVGEEMILPDYFIMKAYLLEGGSYAPLCGEYTSLEQTWAYSEFSKKNAEDFPGQTVLHFDEQGGDNFAVLDSGVIEITCGTSANVLTVEETNGQVGTYILSAPDHTASSLQAEDRVVLYDGAETYAMVVDTAAYQDGSVSLTPDTSAQLGDFFDFIRLDMTVDALADGTQVETGEGITPHEQAVALMEADDTMWLHKMYDVEHEVDGVTITGTLALSAGVNVVFEYAPDLFGEDYYRFESDVEASAETELELTGETEWEQEIEIATLSIPLGSTGLRLSTSISMPMKLHLTGTVTTQYTLAGTYQMSVGGGEYHSTREVTDNHFTMRTRAECEVSLGVVLGLGLDFLGGIAAIQVDSQLGTDVNAVADHTLVDVGTSSEPERHLCTVCIDGVVIPFLEIGVTLSSSIGGIELWSHDFPTMRQELENREFYYALHADGSSIFDWGNCDNTGYRRVYYVINSAGDTLAGADIYVRPQQADGNYAIGSSGLVAYQRAGEYIVDVSLNGYQSKEEALTISGPGEYTVTLTPNEGTDPGGTESVTASGTHYYVEYELENGVLRFTCPEGHGGLLNGSSYPWRGYGSQTNWDWIRATRQIVLGEGLTHTARNSFSSYTNLLSVSLPGTIERIDQASFQQCTSLVAINFPGSLETIGGSAFANCYALSVPVNLPNVTEVEGSAFSECRSIPSASIGGGTIGTNAFFGCYSMTSLDLGAVTSIGMSAFAECSGLTSVTIPGTVTALGQSAFDSCTGLTSITVPGSVTSIGNYTFKACTGLTSATLGRGITAVPQGMFIDCSALEQVYLPSTIQTIGNQAFQGCVSLRQVVITDGVTTVGFSTFLGCSGLRSVTIPASVTSIGQNAFANCPITDIYYGGTQEQWEAISVGYNNPVLETATIHFAG